MVVYDRLLIGTSKVILLGFTICGRQDFDNIEYSPDRAAKPYEFECYREYASHSGFNPHMKEVDREKNPWSFTTDTVSTFRGCVG
jgi:hypothetical protein